jgi:UDP-2,3-diacylglucosamine pyrophosphatase LpxH
MNRVSQTALQLERAFHATVPESTSIEVDHLRLALVSDLHRGIDNGADDASRCKRILTPALRHYLDDGYTLIVVGDAEELWEVRESDWRKIFEAHAPSFALEREFAERNRYFRVFGNHDFAWSNPETVQEYLQPVLGITHVPEAIRINVTQRGQRLGELHLVHGHQGELFSDQLRDVSRKFVRNVWAEFQKKTKKRSSHYRDSAQVEGRDCEIYYDWAVTKERVISIMGHTHRTVFEKFNDPEHPLRVHAQIERFRTRAANVTQPDLRAHMQKQAAAWNDRFARALVPRSDPQVFKPSYFNTGCSSFSNEFVTALEIADGEIRLVAWTPPRDTPERRIIERASIAGAFGQLGGGVPGSFWANTEIVSFED